MTKNSGKLKKFDCTNNLFGVETFFFPDKGIVLLHDKEI